MVFLLTVSVMLSCKDEAREKIPEGILAQEEMAQIMMDMYLLEAKSRSLRIRTDSARKIFRYYEREIFEEYGVSDSLYEASIEFYTNHPQHMTGIYEIMADSLSLKERLGEAATKPEEP